ncbi:MAG: NAD+ synthase [Candidatus Omnitrophica bacterium]|nr:NAD+ synthase [Candidatus Omnitrophota bacterium]
MKIALGQINSTVGDFQANYEKILSFINKARKQKADLVVFPELSLCGYPPEDLLFKKSFAKINKIYLVKIQKDMPSDISVILGYVARHKDKIFNASALISKKKILDIYHKMYLPNYGVFDEKRYFAQGSQARIYLYENLKLALSICEDIWSDEFFYCLKSSRYRPDIIINLSASPFFAGKLKMRQKVLSQRARSLKAFVLYCNLVGGQDELIFDGTSLAINTRGKIVIKAKSFQEDLVLFDSKKRYSPKAIKVDKVAQMYEALILGIKDYAKKNNFKKVVIGVSGGIDSAVTLALARYALGIDNVIALIMPSRFTSPQTLRDAITVSKRLGLEYNIIPIDGVYFSYLSNLNSYLKNNKRYDVACQNLQARIRGNILMSFSNRFGYLVLNTGNKSEISVGYCTLYGDMVGGFGVLKDVYKNKVYKLANFINKKEKKEVIPGSIIKRAPSAELKANQKDEDDLPAYNILDKILKLYIEEDSSKDAIIGLGFPAKIVSRVISMVDKNEYKRRQGPPGIKITPKAFGKDRRMPITNKFVY